MQVAVVTGARQWHRLRLCDSTRENGHCSSRRGGQRPEDKLAALEKSVGDPARVATLAVDLTQQDAP